MPEFIERNMSVYKYSQHHNSNLWLKTKNNYRNH